ncbi:MFS transporter [Legionella sainthelensi]|uniref:MFS transporter n=1 Tax=Legionella sainthelensi TaxID=28087 RepID=UPI000E203767|nr:MFS transporter [Legionella sainthelensi]
MKNKPSYQSIWALSFMIFFISDIQGGIGPILAIYLRSHLGWDTSQVGIALAAAGFVGAICQMPSGILVDAIPFKRTLIGLACGCIIMSCCMILKQTSFYPIIAAQSLVGIASSLIPPSITAVTLGLVGKTYFPIRVTVNESLIHAGTVFTIVVIGIVAQLYGHSWIVYGTIVFSFMALIPLLFINSNEIDHSIARELPTVESDARPVGFLQLTKSKPIVIFFSSVIMFHIANAAQLPLVGQELAEINPDRDAIFMASCIVLAQLVMVIVALSLRLIIDKTGRRPIYLFAFIFLIARALLFSSTKNSYQLLSIQLLDGVSAGIFGVVAVVIVSDLAAGTGRFNFLVGVLGLCVGVGSSISNLAAGCIASAYGFYIGFLFLAVMASVGLLVFGFFLRETKDYGVAKKV